MPEANILPGVFGVKLCTICGCFMGALIYCFECICWLIIGGGIANAPISCCWSYYVYYWLGST